MFLAGNVSPPAPCHILTVSCTHSAEWHVTLCGRLYVSQISSFAHAVPEDVLKDSDLPELVKQLYDVVDWFALGLVLKIPYHKLQNIESDFLGAYTGRTMRLLSCILVEWMQNHQEEATCSTLVHALSAIGKRPAARRITHKYGTCLYGVTKGLPKCWVEIFT